MLLEHAAAAAGATAAAAAAVAIAAVAAAAAVLKPTRSNSRPSRTIRFTATSILSILFTLTSMCCFDPAHNIVAMPASAIHFNASAI